MPFVLRSVLVLWGAVPLLAQVLLVAAVALGTAVGNPTLLWVLAVVACLASGGLGLFDARKENLPATWVGRYGPVLAFLLGAWLLWVADMHASGGDFTRPGLSPALLVPLFLPWVGLAFASAFGGGKWFMLLAPSLAYVGYAAALWWGSRDRPAAGTRPWIPAGAALLVLAGAMGWQFHQRQLGMAPALAGEQLPEELDLRQYQPFARGNKLVPVQPTGGRFAAGEAPRLDGATAAYPLYAAMAQAFYLPDAVSRTVTVSRSGAAYDRLIEGKVDAIFVAQASEAHQRKANEEGVRLQFTPIAREAFVFLVNADNPVRSLTSAQVRGIYAGRIRRWDEVGGRAEAIVPFQRPENSGSQTVMLARVMQGEPMRRPLHEEVAQAMGGLVRRVADYRNAPQSLGYSFRYYTTHMQSPKSVRLLAIDGIEPSAANVRSGAYPYTVDVFMVTTNRSRPGTARLREWLVGPGGQQLVEEVGYFRR